ncbi:MAG: tRNA lysidine(34) synthetase TilS [Gammaproteobacteria bacterium]
MTWFEDSKERYEAAPFLTALRSAIEQWPTPGALPRFLVAFSGGVDSTVLLAALARLGLGARLRAAHVDHGLNADSARWAEQCGEVAAHLGVAFEFVRVNVEGIADHGLEAAARDARYRALGAVLAPGEVLLTAHHADDQLETLLLRFMRGSGVRGLRGIITFGPFCSGFLGRPLLEFTREELRARAREWNLRWIEDPTNREPRHDRNFLRLNVLPQLTARWPAAVTHAGRLAEQMSDAERILDAVAGQDAAGLDEPARVPRAALAVLDAARQRNLLRYLLRRAGLGVPGSMKIEELRHALLEARADAQPLVRWPGGEGRVFGGQLHLLAALPAASPRNYSVRLEARGPWSGPEGTLAFERASAEPGLPESWLDEGLTLKFRGGGEEFLPLGRRHRQPLKRWLQEAAILPWMRSRIPLLFRGALLVAVGDLWLAAETHAIEATERRWRVNWTEHPPLT